MENVFIFLSAVFYGLSLKYKKVNYHTMISIFILNLTQIPRFISFGELSNDEAYPTVELRCSKVNGRPLLGGKPIEV